MTEKAQATKQKIMDAIERDIARDSANVAMYEKLVSILAPFDGKKISKRLKTAIEKQTDWTVYYKNEHVYTLYIWGGDSGRQYDDRWQFFTGCYETGNRTFTLAQFAETNTAYGSAAIGRNVKRQEILADTDRLERLVQAYLDFADAQERLKSAMGDSFSNPSWYGIRDALSLKK